MMTRVGFLDCYRYRSVARVLSFGAALVVGCGSDVDLGRSVSPPGPVSNEHELAAQTTNLVQVNTRGFSSLAIDGEFLYFTTSGFLIENRIWRCRKSDCWATLV